ncbi:MAG: MFS transporter [Candidatus Ranarchaeia archaeon]
MGIQQAQTPSYRWVILALAFSLVGNFAATGNALPPILPILIEEFNITYFQAGLLQGAFNLPAVLLGLVIGFSAQRLGLRRIGTVGTFLFFLGNLIFFMGASFFQFLIGRLVTGVGATTVSVVNLTLISRWFRGKELGLAFGIFNVAYPFSIIVTLTTYGTLAQASGWQFPLIISTLYSLACFIAFILVYRDPPSLAYEDNIAETQPVNGGGVDQKQSILSTFKIIAPLCISYMFFQASSASFTTFTPDYFYRIGFTLGNAGLLTSSWMMGSLFLSIPIGRFLDRYGKETYIIIVGDGVAAIILFMFLILPPSMYYLLGAGLAVAVSPIAVASLRRNSSLSPPSYYAISSSFFATFVSLGFFFGPILTGSLIDITQYHAVIFLVVAILLVLASILQSIYLLDRSPV